MSRAAITAVGAVGAAGVGAAALRDALDRGEPLGEVETVPVVRGGSRSMRLARIAPFRREDHLDRRSLRRMGEAARIWSIACLLAREESGGVDAHAPERRGTFLGTGFGCIDTTWDYLEGLFTDGAGLANPFLFSESVANAPAGHSALALDTRGASVTFTCADASAATSVAMAARAIRDGRLGMAYAGGVELLEPHLLRVLASLGASDPLGEGAVCFVLESLETARERGAAILAEVTGIGLRSDPTAGATDWGRRVEPLHEAMTRAVEDAARCGRDPRVVGIHRHAPGTAEAEAAEIEAVSRIFPDATRTATTRVTGHFAAAGGIPIAAAVFDLQRREPGEVILVNASAWGGSIVSLLLQRPGN